MSTPTISSASADHLCVLVHGLWGNPDHLKSLTNSLHERYPEDRLHVLVTKRNSGSFTYDGAEIGGERAVVEIEEKLHELEKAGHNIRKISIVGYSFGGLVARYAVGLLYHHGLFERIRPVNFTTFATPHLGVRTPLRGYHSHIWNVLGARTLSMSGRQLFGIDKFRDTGRSLLAVLADPESIFIKGLAQFEYRSLYANVVNDRTVTYYTAAISQTDPFVRVDDLQVHYLPGYQDVIVDRENPVSPKGPEEPKALAQRITSGTRMVLGRVAITAALAVFLPIGITGFLLNSVVQTVRSGQRIQLHTEGRAGIDPTRYRIPLMINAVRHEAEQVFESANNSQPQDYLSAGSEDMASPTQPSSPGWTRRKSSVAKSSMDAESVEEQKSGLAMEFPTLALTQDQFKMIEALDNVGFKKHPVYIHKHRHSHAAIIVRMDKESHHEGKMVIKHWLDNFSL